MDWFFDGVTIESPPVEDCYLEPYPDSESSISLNYIIKGYDEEHNVMGVGIPVGAIAASFNPLLSPAAGLNVVMGCEKDVNIRIGGSLENNA